MAATGGEVIGTSRIDLTVDTTGFDLGIKRVGVGLAGLSADAEAQAAKMSKTDIRRAESLKRQAENIHLTREAILAKNIAANTEGKIQQELLGILDKSSAANKQATSVAKLRSDVEVEASKRTLAARTEEQAALARSAKITAEVQAGKDRLAQMRDNASDAFGPQMAQRELITFAKMRAEAEVEASRRIVAARNEEQLAVARGTKVVADAQANQRRLAQMRENAADAFGPQLRAQELANAGAAREAGVRERLAAVMNSERGQRLLVAQSHDLGAAAIARGGNAAAKSGIQFNQYGLSVKQTQAAMRQVPAQMTDIFVSLQGGQNPMTVLMQQGGQLKDVFGGVVPAVKALGAQLWILAKNPIVIAIAAVSTFIYGLVKLDSELSTLGKSIISAGQESEVTTGQLQAMAKAIGDVTAATTGGASSALAQVVQTGKFTTEQYALVTTAALTLQDTTGKAVANTIADFAAIGQSPVAALRKLNDAIGDGTNVIKFLLPETLELAMSLERQGRHAEAAALGIVTYADAIKNSAPGMVANLSNFDALLRDIKIKSKEIGDELLRWSGPAANFGINMIRNLLPLGPRASTVDPRNPFNLPAPVDESIDPIEQDARDKFAADEKARLKGKARMEREIKDMRALGEKARLDPLRMDIQEAAIRETYNKKDAGAASLQRANARSGLQDFKDTLTEKQAAIQADTRILGAQYTAKLVSQTEYFEKTRALMLREAAAEKESLDGQIAFLNSRNVAGRDAVDIERQRGQLEAQRVKLQAQSASELKVLGYEQATAEKLRLAGLADYSEALDLGTEELREQVRAQIASIGMGQREFELRQRLATILREQTVATLALNKAKEADPTKAADIDRQIADQARAARARAQVEKDAYRDINAAQQDWRAGMRAGLQDWITQASDVAGQVRNITVGALDRIGEGFAELALTGKMNYKALLADILTEITKFLAKQAVLKFVEMFASWYLGGGSVGTPVRGEGVSSYKGSVSLPTGYAQGGVITNSPSLSAYSNQVVSQPTPFFFAKGGVMGEAGSEAIMPLTRGADGNLGVRVHGGGGGGPVNLNMQFNITSDGSSQESTSGDTAAKLYREFGERIRTVAQDEIMRSLRPNGTLWKAGVAA